MAGNNYGNGGGGSETSNAVGTARQFTPQPASTYQRQLTTPNGGMGFIKAARSTLGEDLANALGVVGDGLDTLRVEQDKRQKEIAEKIAPILYGRENHDTRLLMNGIAMVNKSGIGDLQDNPYALAVIDRLKGQEISAEIHKRYKAYTSQERLKGTLQEEIKSYDEFFEEHVQEFLDNTSVNNRYALDTGLYESRVVNTSKVAEEFVGEKAEEMSITRAESLFSYVDDRTRNKWAWSKEDIEDFSTQVGNILTTTQERNPQRNQQIISTILKRVAQNTGSPELIESLKNATIYGDQRLGNLVDVEQYKELADESNKTHFMQKTRDVYDKLSKITDVKALYASVDEMEDPEARNIASGMLGGFVRQIEADKKADARLQKTLQARATQYAQGQLNLQAQIEAIKDGRTADVFGNGIALTSQQLRDAGFSDSDLQNVIYSELGNTRWDDPESMTRTKRLFFHPTFIQDASRAMSYFATAGLQSLSAANPQPSEMLLRCVEMYKADPSGFSALVKDTTTQAGIMCVADMGIDTYLRAADQLKDSNKVAQLQSDLSGYVENGISTMSLPDLADGSSYTGFTYGEPNSADLRDRYSKYALVYRATNMSVAESISATNYKIASEYYSYRGCPIPKGVVKLADIGGTSESDCRSTFYWVIEQRLKQFCSYQGVDPSFASVSFSSGNGTVGGALITFMLPNGEYMQEPIEGRNGIATEARADLVQVDGVPAPAPQSADDNNSIVVQMGGNNYDDDIVHTESGIEGNLDYINNGGLIY